MRTSCLPGDQDAHHSFTLPEMWRYPTLMKVVPDILKRRLGLHPRLAHEDLTFATSKLAHHLRVPPTPSSALPPRLPPPPISATWQSHSLRTQYTYTHKCTHARADTHLIWKLFQIYGRDTSRKNTISFYIQNHLL